MGKNNSTPYCTTPDNTFYGYYLCPAISDQMHSNSRTKSFGLQFVIKISKTHFIVFCSLMVPTADEITDLALFSLLI